MGLDEENSSNELKEKNIHSALHDVMTWNIGENRKTIHTMKTIKPAYDREGFAVF